MKLKLKYNLYLIFPMILLLLSGTLFLTDKWAKLQPLMLGLSIFILHVIALFKNIKLRINVSVFITVSIYTFFCIISSLVNSDLTLFIRSLVFYLTYSGCVIVIPNVLLEYLPSNIINKFIIDNFLYSHMPLIFIPILLNGIVLNSYNAYQGIFYNPNPFGAVTASIATVILSNILNMLDEWFFYSKKIKKKKMICMMILLILLVLLIIISQSRTSVITIILLLLMSVFVLFKKSIKKGNIKMNVVKKIIFFIIVATVLSLILYYLTPLGTIFDFFILSKFRHKKNDVLDGRTEVWFRTIKEAKPFGHGRGFFDDSVSAHNTFISVLAQYGWIPTVLFILFLFQALISAYKYAVSSIDDRHKYFPLLILTAFLLMSMAEGMLYKVSMFLSFICFGITDIGLRTKKSNKGTSKTQGNRDLDKSLKYNKVV